MGWVGTGCLEGSRYGLKRPGIMAAGHGEDNFQPELGWVHIDQGFARGSPKNRGLAIVECGPRVRSPTKGWRLFCGAKSPAKSWLMRACVHACAQPKAGNRDAGLWGQGLLAQEEHGPGRSLVFCAQVDGAVHQIRSLCFPFFFSIPLGF